MRRHLMKESGTLKLVPLEMPECSVNEAWGIRVSASEFQATWRFYYWNSGAATFQWSAKWGASPLFMSIEGLGRGDVVGFGNGPASDIQKSFNTDGVYEIRPDEVGDSYGIYIWNKLSYGPMNAITIKFYHYERI